jgi:uroporphyrinogen-III synthase
MSDASADASGAPLAGRPALLAGKRIVITRALEQAIELGEALIALGAQVLLLPLVEFSPVQDSETLDAALARHAEFDAILFLSANAVRYVFERCRNLGVAFDARHRPRIVAAIGPATARALAVEEVQADYVARESTAAALAKELKDALVGTRVLLPRSDRGSEAAPLALVEIGAMVTEVVAYRTGMPGSIDAMVAARVSGGEIDAIVFSSPSAVKNFVAVFGDREAAQIAQRASFAAIGPTTAQALRHANLPVAIEAPESSTDALVAAIAGFFEGQAAQAKGTS